MKQLLITIILLILIASCEKSVDIGEILKFYGDAGEDVGYSIAITDDGYFICGQMTQITRSPGNAILGSSRKIGILKTGPDGNLIWKKYFGDRLQGSGSKIIVLDDGSAVCAGQVTDTVELKTDIFVVKISSDGGSVTEKIFKTTGNQTSTDILKTPEGFLLLGTTDVERLPLTDSTGNRAGKKDILLMRLYDNLEQISTVASKGFPGDDYGVSLKNDASGGFIIAGTTDRSEPGQANSNLYLLKVNTFGSETQSAIIGGTDDEYASDLEVLNDGFILAGTIGREGEHQSVYITKIPNDINSGPLFTNKINRADSWSVKAISGYMTNSFVLAGKAGSKMLIFVIDPEGNPVPGMEKVTGTSGQTVNDIAADDAGYLIAVGKSSYENNSMISLLKFNF